jgi:NAD(P)-dependent dehydrogenase (short-subunit alcohol dehydrogenase family)
MASLIDKVAIVAGSSRGIGRAIIGRFAAEGAAIVVNYAQRRRGPQCSCEYRSEGRYGHLNSGGRERGH